MSDLNDWSKVGIDWIGVIAIQNNLKALRQKIDHESINLNYAVKLGYANEEKIKEFYSRNCSRIWAINLATVVARLNDCEVVDSAYIDRNIEPYTFKGSKVDAAASKVMFMFLMGQLKAVWADNEPKADDGGLCYEDRETEFLTKAATGLATGINNLARARHDER